MGNAQSAQEVESHGRHRASHPHAQKLSKPKVGNHRSGRQYSTPGSVEGTSPVPAVPTVNVGFANHARPLAPTPEQLNKQLPPLVRDPQDRNEFTEIHEKKMSRRLSIFRSRSSSREPTASRQGMSRRDSFFASRKPKTDDSLSLPNSRVTSRANPMAVDSGGGALYSAQAPDGWQPNGSRTSWNYDMNSYEAKRMLNWDEQPAMSESRRTVESDTKSSTAAHGEIAPISRVNSDVSLYAPVRRRSIQQVPGVATRTNSLADSSRPNFRHSPPPTPSMSRQASIESIGSCHLSMPPPIVDADLAPRVLTPNDGDNHYQTTGAFKFGTLRIVNGVASPAPSPEPKSGRREIADRSSADYCTRPRKSLPHGKVNELSPLNLPAPSTSAGITGLGQPGTSDLAPGSWSENHSGEFLPRIQCTPFDVTEPPISSPGLKTTSKHTALEDNLFEDEAQLEFTSREVLDVRLDPNAKSDGTPSRVVAKGLSRSDSGFIPSPTSEYSWKPLSKADSGYSSNVSLRSLRGSEKSRKGKTVESPVHQGPASPQSTSSYNSASSLASAYPPRSSSRQSGLPPIPPPKDLSTPTSQSTKAVPAITPVPLFNRHRPKKRPSPSPISTTKSSTENSLRSPGSLKSASSATSTASGSFSDSSLSVGSGIRKKSKFHRVFTTRDGSQRGPPTTHTTHVQDLRGLPSIPPNVEERLHRHVGLYPSAPRRLALRSQRSKDTLKTIFSVGSLEFHNIDPEPSTTPTAKEEPAPEPAPKTQPARYRHTLQSIVRKSITRKPVPSQGEEQGQDKASSLEVVVKGRIQLARASSVSKSFGATSCDATCPSSQAKRAAAGRAMNITTQMERTAALNAFATRRRSFSPEDSPVSPCTHNFIVPELAPPDLKRRGRTPPPVVTRTQRTRAGLRVPLPLRSKSTPPSQTRPVVTVEEMKAPKNLPMSSTTSQQLGQQQLSPTQTSSHRPIPIRDPRMGQGHGSFVRAPSREPSPGPSSSWPNSLDHGRDNPLPFQGHSTSGLNIQRPSSSMDPRRPSNAAPQLRHHASFDGFNNPNRQSWAVSGYVQQGYMWQQQQLQQQQMQQEQLHMRQQHQQQVVDMLLQQNGVPFVPQGMNINHQKISQPSWEQDGSYPFALPRGHHRHKSLEDPQTGAVQAPFRVLHSYNSPAYRGVPIWG